VINRRTGIREKTYRIAGKHGTRTSVRDLFGNLPVRLKQRAVHFENADNVERELDRLKSRITALTLAWPRSVRIVVRDEQAQHRRRFTVGSQTKVTGGDREHGSKKTSSFRLHRICGILANAGYIPPMSPGAWTSISARTAQISVRAAISLDPAPSKQVQFISVGIHPLHPSTSLSQVLYREVNDMFSESAFGAAEDDLDVSEEERLRRLKDRRFKTDGHTNRQIKGLGKGTDRWPMFYIRIDTRDQDLPANVVEFGEDDKQAAKFLERTVQLIRSMIYQFLQEHHFRPRGKSVRSRPESPRKCLKLASSFDYGSDSADAAGDQRPSIADGKIKRLGGDVVRNVHGEQHRLSRQRSSTAPIESWSRIKSGKRSAMEDLLSGLPRKKTFSDAQRSTSEPGLHGKEQTDEINCKNAFEKDKQMDEDIQLLLADLNEADTEGPSETLPQAATEGESLIQIDQRPVDSRVSEDGVIFWTNPVSGKTVRINSRTGQALLDLPLRPATENLKFSSDFSANPASNVKHGSAGSLTKYSQSGSSAQGRPDPDSWLGRLLRNWNTPVFRQKERPIPSAVTDYAEGSDVRSKKCCHGQYNHCATTSTADRDGRLSKAALANATIIGQVDKKFILALVEPGKRATLGNESEGSGHPVLVLIDQHAADERCRVEDLYKEICNVTTMRLPKPITFEIPQQEVELFRRERTFLETWAFHYDIGTDQISGKHNSSRIRPASARSISSGIPDHQQMAARPATSVSSTTSARQNPRQAAGTCHAQVQVHAVPKLIAERCRLDPKLLIDILRSEVWARKEASGASNRTTVTSPQREEDELSHSWLNRISSCPRGIIELLNSRSCRSAIMFNDELTKMECDELVKKLAKCTFPFQCAHGRPSMMVLGGLESSTTSVSGPTEESSRFAADKRSSERTRKCNSQSFAQAFKAWQQD
jgi:DNA mismatch repair protein MLH3